MDEISRAIGSLEGLVKSLTDTWVQQDQEATEGRRALYGKFEELKTEVNKTTAKVETLVREMSEIKPAVKNFEAARQRREGANSLMKILWGGVVAFATGIGYLLHDYVGNFFRPH